MLIPGLGEAEKDEELGWYFCPRTAVAALNGAACCLVLDGVDGDPRPEDFVATIAAFLSIGGEALKQAEPFVFQYYEDCRREPVGDRPVEIASPADVWRHVRFGDEVMVRRRRRGDGGVYVSVTCNCDWEREHGMQLVFKGGRSVNKVGAFDDHLSNADAYAEPTFEDVVYVTREALRLRRSGAGAKAKAGRRPKRA